MKMLGKMTQMKRIAAVCGHVGVLLSNGRVGFSINVFLSC